MKPIVPNDKCLTQEQILRYLRDECQPSEIRIIDKHLSQCPMCSDAVEGAMMLDTKELEFAWAQSQAHIKAKTEELATAHQPLKAVRSKPIRFLRFTLGAAASVALLAAAAIWLLTKPLDQNTPETSTAAPPQLTPADSAYFSQKPEVIEPSSTAPVTIADAQTNASKSNVSSSEVQKPSNYTSTSNIKDTTEAIAAASAPNEPKAKEPINEAAEKIGDYANARAADMDSKQAKETEYREESLDKKRSAPAAMASKAKAYKSENNRIDDSQILESGAAFLRSNKYDDAIKTFNLIINKSPKSNQYEQALWYNANALLMSGNKSASKAAYTRIAKEKGKYAAQAENLLSKWKD